MNCEHCNSPKEVSFNRKLKKHLCRRHSVQVSRYGNIRKRTLADKNDFLLKSNHAEIIIYNRKCEEVARAKVDKEDLDRIITAGSWCIDYYGYAMNGKHGAMHRFIIGKREGYEIDHKNRNKLDNRKQNLRFVTHRVNTINRDAKNVFKLSSGRWGAMVGWKGEQNYLGTFDSEREAKSAAKNYKDALIEQV